MATTQLADVQDQIQEFWSDLFMGELLESTLLPSLVNRDYEGEIRGESGGDTVYVSQINRPDAERKTVGAGADVFNPSKLNTQRVAIECDQRITASFEFNDLVDLQSQIMGDGSAIRQALLEATDIELNNYLYSVVAPSASSPDHTITGVTNFDSSQVNSLRKLASQAKWSKQGGWWLLADPQYTSDMLNDSTLTSADFGAVDAPVIGGQMARQRYGFNILEDNSAGLASLSSGIEDAALAFHPDFMALCMQKTPEFKVSDLHANKQFGYVISVTMIVGADLLPDGENKHITVIDS